MLSWCMGNFFAPNITGMGRWIRGLTGLACLAGGVYVALSVNGWLGGGLMVCGLFTLYEAVRGWCVLRACGLKTKF